MLVVVLLDAVAGLASVAILPHVAVPALRVPRRVLHAMPILLHGARLALDRVLVLHALPVLHGLALLALRRLGRLLLAAAVSVRLLALLALRRLVLVVGRVAPRCAAARGGDHRSGHPAHREYHEKCRNSPHLPPPRPRRPRSPSRCRTRLSGQ